MLKNKTPDDLLKFCFNNLDDFGVEYALEHGASDMEEIKLDKYPESVIWIKNGKALFDQDLEDMTLYVSYSMIWKIFEYKYNYNYNDIKTFIKNMLEKQFNIKCKYKIIPSATHWNIMVNQLNKK